MNYPAYPKYRDSGVEWISNVPNHWVPTWLKWVSTYRVSNVDKVPTDDERSVRLCNYTDVYYNEIITPGMDLMDATATSDEIRRFRLLEGDVVITKDSESWNDIAIPALVAESAPDLVCGYHLAFIRPIPDVLLGAYLFRCLQAEGINQQFQVASTGVTRYGLPKSAIGNAFIPLPPLSEQQTIVDFLDTQTAKIDTLVAKKRELVEKLKEKRTALISRTVTRDLPPDAARADGLDPNPPLKPSGIEWIGDVPENWKVLPARRVAIKILTGSTPPTTEERFYEDGTIPWYGPSSFRDDITLQTPVKMIHQSAIAEGTARLFNTGSTMIVGIGATLGKVSSISGPASCNQQITAVEFDRRKVHPRYGSYAFKRLESIMHAIAPSATLAILAQGQIAALHVCVPPVSEQRAIADYLDRETGKIDCMVEKIEKAIDRLQEYRAALITAAVTGKIDVREVAV